MPVIVCFFCTTSLETTTVLPVVFCSRSAHAVTVSAGNFTVRGTMSA